MHDQDTAIIRALIPVAWADGVFADREKEMLDGLLDAYQASDDQRATIHEYAKRPRTLEDVDPQELSADDRRILLQHAVLLTFVDGDQSGDEVALLVALSRKLRIPDAEATALMAAGAERAKKLLHLI
jgi:uncharacterized membrane protein YebE (DUF533 family)